MKNSAGSAASPETKVQPLRRPFHVSLSDRCNSAGFGWFGVFVAIAMVRTSAGAADFQFDRDTPAFANQTVFEYHEGHPPLRKPSTVNCDAYKGHRFVLLRNDRY